MQNSLTDKLLFLKAIGYKFIDKSNTNIANNIIFNNLDELKNQIGSCSLCYLKNRSKSVFLGYGNIGAKILILSFIGADAQNEHEFIKNELDLDEKDIYLSSILRCSSTYDTLDECITMCKPYILQEINLLKPKLILTLGAKALFAIMPELRNSDINSIRGSFLKFANTILMPTFSLQWINKNPSFKPEFLNDLEKIKGVL